MTDRSFLELTQRIEAKLLSGELPARSPLKTWGGLSGGGVCAVCDEAIGKGTAEIEVDGVDGPTRVHHVRCYVLLDAVRGRPGASDR